MPVNNESRTLRTIIERVLHAPVDVECVVDYSRDGSPELLNDLARAESRIKVDSQPVNLGKGTSTTHGDTSDDRCGWRLNHGRSSGRITPFASRLFDPLVPVFKRLDGVVPGKGLTWLAVARAP